MELTDAQVEEIEAALELLDQLDPAELPEPAAKLAGILSGILEDMDSA